MDVFQSGTLTPWPRSQSEVHAYISMAKKINSIQKNSKY
ncbi:hypothetical protein D1AOALGA4SA_6107 [Olavius algarvensis Delta 1 endosymbiont]|nr:hypothetical protein D1AOALGA4SA_6107 [Olavius algarvensis Delta 1 endosymbiont]